MAWIIGWDLILEYAVGNVAVAISWGDYFTTLLRGVGIELPAWLTTGYRTALLSSNPDVHGLLDTAPHVAGIPILVNLPGVRHRDARSPGCCCAARARARAPTTSWWSSSCWRWRCSSASALTNINPANYTPFAPNGFTGIHQGAAIVFFAYIGFDAISTAAEETQNPQRNLPIGILGGLADLHGDLRRRRRRAHRHGAVSRSWRVADPLARALELAGYSRRRAGSSRSAPRCR